MTATQALEKAKHLLPESDEQLRDFIRMLECESLGMEEILSYSSLFATLSSELFKLYINEDI